MKYRMTDEEREQLLNAHQPVTYIVVGGREPTSPYENAMRVWDNICARVGCYRDTVKSGGTGDDRDFEAEPIDLKP